MPTLSVKIYNTEGEEAGDIKLPAGIFGIEINNDLLHQAITIQRTNSRKVFAHTKDRSEVRGGGKKPWQQKGTGRARHGSTRSPVWVGGGITFGPRKEKNFKKKINKKAKRKAIFMALSSKVKDEELLVLDKLELKEPKTKAMVKILESVIKKRGSILIATAKKNDNIIKASRNISYVKIIAADSLNVIDILSFKYLLLDKEAVKKIEEIYKK